jgi:hypothetical protein
MRAQEVAMSAFRPVLAAGALALLVVGCASTPKFSADVTRFHLDQPLARGAVFIEAVPGATPSMEDRFWQAAVASELQRLGFTVADARANAELVGVVGVGRGTRATASRSSSPSVGVGMAGGGSAVAGGISVGIPLGGQRSGETVSTSLELALRRASDATTVWEGRAVSSAPAGSALAQPATLAPQLAGALLAEFPGASGQTVRYPRGRR